MNLTASLLPADLLYLAYCLWALVLVLSLIHI